MNGLDFIDLQDASFADRLLKREPRENAFVEINNILASVPILRIEKQTIDDCLQKYDVSIERAIPRFIEIYSRVLTYLASDFVLSSDDAEQLWYLQNLLSLSDEQIGAINAMIIYPIFQNVVSNLILDGDLSLSDQQQLDQLAAQLRISEETKQQLYSSVVHPFFQSKLHASIADRLFSPEDERELTGLAKNLKLSLVYDATMTQNLERFRYLWRLHSGDLPNLQVPLYLQRDEFCSAYVTATYHEMANVTTGIRYSGTSYSHKDFWGTRYNSGTVKTQRVTEQIMQFLGEGTLFFTNRRLLFNGSRINRQIPLNDIIGATFYTDGLLIERDAGIDQIFKFYADFEALKLIFDSLMTKNRM